MWTRKQEQRLYNERLRGWIIYLLYKAKPKPMEMAGLLHMLDARNMPIPRRRLAEEVDYLRSSRLLRVFPQRSDKELDEMAQAKWIQRYADCDNDEEVGDMLCVRITTAGINFQDGVTDKMDGISRVE